jgi:putative peptidoglycan lipid II flippase
VAETLRSSARISVAVGISRVLGVVRESTFAALFGGGALADAYQVAFTIPNLLRDLFAEGALSSAFVPTFTASLVEGSREVAFRLGNLVLSGVLVVTGATTLAGIVWSEEIVTLISAGFAGDQAKIEIAARLTRVMMPLLALVSLGAVWMGMLNAQRRWLAPAYAPAAFNLTSILVGIGLVFGALDRVDALMIWCVGTLAAGVVQAFVQLPALWRLGYRPQLVFAGMFSDPRVRRIARLMLPAVIGLAAVQINIFVNTRFAGSLGDGPVAQLKYAFRVFYLPIGLFSVALATVSTTRISEEAARHDRPALLAATAEALGAVWMLMSASAIGLFVLAEPVVRLLFERGAFGGADTTATALVLQAYALGLLPYGLVKILAPVFYGVDRPRIPLVGSLAAVAVNLAFNTATYEQLGAPGLALGTGLGAVANVLLLRIAIVRTVGSLEARGRWRHLGALVVANALLGAAVFGADAGLAPLLDRFGGAAGQLVSAVALGAVVTAGFFLYVGVLRGLGYPGADLLWGLPGRLYRRLRGR